MKLHVTVGADILTAIDFPYPVVPIVRCHHENWDGTGYPAGLKGTDIPIGARILSVVDCFDALTSDRPYRPRLSDDEALGILFERRGSMYDPLVVDTFARVHFEIAPEPPPVGDTRRARRNRVFNRTDSLSNTVSSTKRERPTIEEALALFESARALAGHASVSDTFDLIAKHLHQLLPSPLCVLFYDARTDELEARHATGVGGTVRKGITD